MGIHLKKFNFFYCKIHNLVIFNILWKSPFKSLKLCEVTRFDNFFQDENIVNNVFLRNQLLSSWIFYWYVYLNLSESER